MTDLIEETQRGDLRRPIPRVGAFVLETLTLGMYGEPRHTLREYIQNAFDGIRMARRQGRLTGRGEVTVTIEEDALKILDNGIGVPATQAWTTLTSIGASKKDRLKDAGFRGIGRLAGMAYCDELVFRTSFQGEAIESIVQFDCQMLLEAMKPEGGSDLDLGTLMDEAVTIRTSGGVAEESHYFEVSLRGLRKAPQEFTDPDSVSAYLSETVPVPFNPDWELRKEVEATYRAAFGEPMETIDVYVSHGEQKEPIFKAYSDEVKISKGLAQIEGIKYYADSDGRYFVWYGELSKPAAVTDQLIRGLRIRVRNIQVDGTEIMDALFREYQPSYDRFNRWYIGEIHIAPRCVVPNARRDGFEEDASWGAIKAALIASVCADLSRAAYQASKKRQNSSEKILADVDKLLARSESLIQNTQATYDQVVENMATAKKLRQSLIAALRSADDQDEVSQEAAEEPSENTVDRLREASRSVESIERQARMLMGQFTDKDDRILPLRERLRTEILRELLDVVSSFVDPSTYQRIRRELGANEPARQSA